MDYPPIASLCETPAYPPPSGVPNFDDPPSLAPALNGVAAVMISSATFFLACRLWANRHRLSWVDGE